MSGCHRGCTIAYTLSCVTMTIESSTNTCAQLDTKSNPNPNPNPNPITKQHAVENSQLNIPTCPIYVSRQIHTRQCCCTVCTNFDCNFHTACLCEALYSSFALLIPTFLIAIKWLSTRSEAYRGGGMTP